MEKNPDRLRITVSELIDSATNIVEQKYGKDSKTPKGYHNRYHTLEVIDSASQLADLAIANNRLDPSHKPLLLIAAAYHDIEQDLGPGKNEVCSAEIAVKAMEETGLFDAEACGRVYSSILGTRVSFEEGVMRQAVTPDSDYMVQLLADADLMNLGSNEELYWERSIGIFCELYPGKDVTDMEWGKFLEKQVILLSNHQYWTPEGRSTFTRLCDNLSSTEIALRRAT